MRAWLPAFILGVCPKGYHVWVARPFRILALDVGDRRIGIAVTDALGVTVQGRKTRTRQGLSEDMEHIRTLVAEDGVEEVVVGHPLRMGGEVGAQARKCEAFAQRLREVLGIPVMLWDERLTSFAAEQHLEELGLDWRRRRKHVDELSAVLILEDYLRQRS